MLKRTILLGLLFMLALSTAAFAAVNVTWMPGFPMRLPGAGVMGMVMPVPGATAYKVQRMVTGGQFETIATVQINNFSDPTAPTDKDVSYKIVAVIGGADAGESPVTVLKGEKPIDAPTEVAHRLDPEAKSLLIRWERSEGASFYNIYKADKAGDAGTLLGSVQEGRYTDTKIEDGKSYFYSITAVSATSKESPRTAEYKVEVKYPKVAKVKKFDYNTILITHETTSWGEEGANFINPSDVLVVGDRVYVACEDGVQILDFEGQFVGRMPIIQENVANGKYKRPWLMTLAPNGNIWFGFLGENVMREITPDGTAEVSSVVLPTVANNKLSPQSVNVAFDKEGNRWVTDEGYSNIAILPPNVSANPKSEDTLRIGFDRGNKEVYDEAKHGVTYVGVSRIKYIEQFGKIAVLEATRAQVTFIDPKTRKNFASVLGIGADMNKVSLCGDFAYYDKNLLLVIDSLKNELKLIKIADKAEDETMGDYVANLIDDDSPTKAPKLVAPFGSTNKIALVKDQKKLFLLSSLSKELYIYNLP